MRFFKLITPILLLVSMAAAGWAQTETTETTEDRPAGLSVLFSSGASSIRPDQEAVLDQAVRTFRSGDWGVMIVSGSADTVGDPEANLDLSVRRARSVADGLVARGIPVQSLQVLGRGNSELPVPTDYGVPSEANRSALITWR